MGTSPAYGLCLGRRVIIEGGLNERLSIRHITWSSWLVRWSKETETVIWTGSCWINLSWAKFEDKVEGGEEEVKEEGGGTKGQEREERGREDG